MNKENYDNFLTTFKKQLWDRCISEDVFSNSDNSEFQNIKIIFERNVENYKSHILQTNGSEQITETLLKNIKFEILRRKGETSKQIRDANKDEFEDNIKKKKDEFDSLIKKVQPQNIDFSDNSRDEPLDAHNLETLIEEQLKDRQLDIDKITDETNTIVSANPFIQQNTGNEQITVNPQIIATKNATLDVNNIQINITNELKSLTDEVSNMNKQISDLKTHIQLQNTVIDKIVNSQILILKKLK